MTILNTKALAIVTELNIVKGIANRVKLLSDIVTDASSVVDTTTNDVIFTVPEEMMQEENEKTKEEILDEIIDLLQLYVVFWNKNGHSEFANSYSTVIQIIQTYKDT